MTTKKRGRPTTPIEQHKFIRPFSLDPELKGKLKEYPGKASALVNRLLREYFKLG